MFFELKEKNFFSHSAAQNSRLVRSVGTPNLKYLFASFHKGITLICREQEGTGQTTFLPCSSSCSARLCAENQRFTFNQYFFNIYCQYIIKKYNFEYLIFKGFKKNINI